MQTEAINTDDNKIYNPLDLEIKPEFTGGTVKFHQFIDDNYRKTNKKPTLQGKLFATFIIEKKWHIKRCKSSSRYWFWHWR